MKKFLMDRRFIAVIGVLVLAGLALAFAVAFLTGEGACRTENIWLVQNPPLTKTDPLPSGNETSCRPAGTTNTSTVSEFTGKIIGQNQSALLLSFNGKPGTATIIVDNPQTGMQTLTEEQKDFAEQVALSDSQVQNLLGASMYTMDVQPLRSVTVEDSGGATAEGTDVSIVFTTINTTMAKNETIFYVHVDLDSGKIAGISPVFSLS